MKGGVSHARSLIVLVLFLSLCQARVFALSYTFQHLSTADGLSHKTVTCFLQDKRGFIWVGTTNGLNRYDGYRFETFFHDDEANSISGNIIYDMVEDGRGLIWISTNNGFCFFDPRYESFHKVSVPGKGSNYQTRSLCIDDDGNVWGVDENNYLMRLPVNRESHVINSNIDSLLGKPGKTRIWLIRSFDGYLWVCSSSGIVRFDYKRSKATVVAPYGVTSVHLRSIKRGRENELLVVDAQKGIFKLNTQTLSYELVPFNVFKAGGFDFWNITDVEHSGDGRMWTSTAPGLFVTGLNGVTTRLNLETGSSHNFDKTELTSIFKDREDNLWIGTMDLGLYVLSNKKAFFSHHQYISNDGERLSASRIYVSGKNEILFGNPQGAYYCNSIRDMDAGNVRELLDKPICAISKLNERECVIFTAKMIYIFDFATKRLRDFTGVNDIQTGFVDSRAVIWVGSWGRGLRGYDYETRKEYAINIDTMDHNRNIIFTMCEDPDGSLWVGTYGTGLVHVQNPTSSSPGITIYSHVQGENSMSLNEVISVHDDGNGSVWAGTCGGGLNRFSKKTGRFDVFSTNNGLKNNVVESVNSDLDGNLWVSSSVLTKFDIREKTFTHFDVSDGLVGEYFTSASFRAANGTMYFGDDKGLLLFNPREIPRKRDSRVPEFTAVRLFGMPVRAGTKVEGVVPFPVSVGHAGGIVLPYYLNTFTLEFASIQILDNKNTTYSYVLEGLDDKWIPVSPGEHSASFTGLQPGAYTFKVRSSNGAGTWSTARELAIVITPPWWQTLWFKITGAFLLTLILTLFTSFRIRKFKAKSQELEKLVKERTSDLEQANVVLTEQSERLNSQTEWLQQQNKSLTEKQLVIEMKSQQLEEALDSKDRLIGVIAHDFKNPLAGIHGMLDLLRNHVETMSIPRLKEHLDTILFSSTRLKDQMITVLDWAQGQMQDLVARPVEINIETIIDDAIVLVGESSAQKHISINTQLDYSSNALIDPRMMSTVMRNLLVNAIKFTPRGGEITVIVQEYDSGIEVNVVDSGVGMSQEMVGNLFGNSVVESTYGTDNEKGTGLGLRICQSFVEKNHGTIHVKSKEGEGAVFSVSIPKGRGEATRKEAIAAPTVPLEQPGDETLGLVADKSQTILLIDDDASIISILKSTLEQYYTILVAVDGRSGLQLARNMVPNLIISDINMPHVNGMELCKLLKEDAMTSHIPIVLITSAKSAMLQRQSYASGADDFVEKPIDKVLFQCKVKSLLDNRKKVSIQKQTSTGGSAFILPESFDDMVMKRALDFINQNFSNSELDMNLVAETVGLSRTQLWRKFKSTTGNNLSDYIQDLRLRKACDMLLTRKYKVSEIAYEVGFSSPTYFSKCFSDRFNMSPREFEEKHGA